jgi:hypothetical protein
MPRKRSKIKGRKRAAAKRGQDIRDRVTGIWFASATTAEIVIDRNPTSDDDPKLFGLPTSGAGRTINYDGYRDSNFNHAYDSSDVFVGSGTITSLDGVVYGSGSFISNRGRFEGYVGDKQVAIGYGFESWFL